MRRLSPDRVPSLRDLERLAWDVLDRAEYAPQYLAFAVVAVSNAFWRPRFAAIPFRRRLLLLPHCIRNSALCRGEYDGGRFDCAGCGCCDLGLLIAEARQLGYHVLTAEGTPPLLAVLRSGTCDAALGVACLDSLEHTFRHVSATGIPALAIPLLFAGCVSTQVEADVVRDFLTLTGSRHATPLPNFLPLWRAVDRLFQEPAFSEILVDSGTGADPSGSDPTEKLAIDWLREGGKRIRPFMTLGVYAALHSTGKSGKTSSPPSGADAVFGPAVQRFAIAMEALHKASLAHDDIADNDAFRYGRPTLHREFDVPTALNAGDHLIGMGYRLVLSAGSEVGPETANAFLAHLAETHQALCRGQGQELGLTGPDAPAPRPLDILTVYARKTAAAFAVSLEAGAAAAGYGDVYYSLFRRFARALGVAYQIQNDLDDWRDSRHNKRVSGQDALRRCPTILRAFAVEQAGVERESEVLDGLGADNCLPAVERLRAFYRDSGAFARAEALQTKLMLQAADLAGQLDHAGLRGFLRFLVELLFPGSSADRPG